MFKCCECGHLFGDGEQAVWVELHGEKWTDALLVMAMRELKAFELKYSTLSQLAPVFEAIKAIEK